MMKTFILASAVAIALWPTAAAAGDQDILKDLGTVLGSGDFCGLTLDDDAIEAYLPSPGPQHNMEFTSLAHAMWAAVAVNLSLPKSAKAARCAYLAKLADSYGLTH
ncbi:MAG: hypothetical protein WBG11_14605 [Methylocella sp.]